MIYNQIKYKKFWQKMTKKVSRKINPKILPLCFNFLKIEFSNVEND